MDKKLLFIIILLLSTKTIAQDDHKALYGKIYDELGVLSNTHIININTKKATYSNDNGEFKIFIKIGDSLKITSVGYKTLFIKTAKKHLGISENYFKMEKEIIELDEIEVKQHNLTGSLALDFKQTPKDKKAIALANTMDFSKVNMKAKTKDDYIDRHVRPPTVMTDPIGPANVVASVPFGYSEKLWALRRKLAFKENFPAKLLGHFGEDFFFKDLKIPIEKYTHFITYCSYLDIEKLYKEHKLMEIVQILRKEHVEYLKTINNHK